MQHKTAVLRYMGIISPYKWHFKRLLWCHISTKPQPLQSWSGATLGARTSQTAFQPCSLCKTFKLYTTE